MLNERCEFHEQEGSEVPDTSPEAGLQTVGPQMEGSDPADPDIALIQAAGRGDPSAGRLVVQQLLPPIVSFSTRMLGDAAEAEDVAQEVFVKAWKAAATWQPGKARFTTWLFRVAHNACIDRIRRRPDALPEDFDQVDQSERADETVEREQQAENIRKAVTKLPERQRAALALCYYQELSNREAAEIMDVSVDALESLLARARRGLKEQMERQGHG